MEVDARGWGAQQHLAVNLPFKFATSGSVLAERERDASRVPNMQSVQFGDRADATDYPDVYVNGEDVTVTVDPYKNSVWIRNDAVAERHDMSNHRGALKDHKGVMDTLRILNMYKEQEPWRNYTERDMKMQIDGARKYSGKCVRNSTRGSRIGDPAKEGQLPINHSLNYNGLDGHSFGSIGWRPNGRDWMPMGMFHDGKAPFIRDVNRAFDCGGQCR